MHGGNQHNAGEGESTGGEPAEEGSETSPRSRRDLWKPIVLLVVIAGLFVAALNLDLGERVAQLRGWIDALGPWAPLAFIALYVLAVVMMVPGTAPSAIAGGLFGSLWGTVYVSIGSTLGAVACFLSARYFARDAVAAWLAEKPRFRKLDRLTETHGAWIVAITRLVPVFPFNVLNYGFGLTRVRLWTYAFWSWLCMLPGTVMYVVGADAIVRGFREGRVPWVLVGVVIGLIALLTGIGCWARRRLRAAEREAGVEPEDSE
jgi:uncharacterized membrane protein YdjX (TVP38/TMEM64 family)